ncbi:family 1 putative glycosyltransferase [Triangularia setosa]|uniref:Family 1 putative glycosyltransferase n=1 Tax=Triangularia setosa TaxID=2587417 RepID=A0AAN6W6M2_9PEZI|nr:family 1 putative glycosyltransferase [Podospora setosa]
MTVEATGRVSIHLLEKNRRLSTLLAPAIAKRSKPPPLPPLPSGPLPPPYIPPNLGGLPGQTPPPKLNVVIQIVGSRGDVQPFIALGLVLRDTYGHRVRIATHSTFKNFVEENGLEFFDIGGDPAELMAFMVKHPGLMPGFEALRQGEIRRRRKGVEEMLEGCWRSCITQGGEGDRPFVADAIIANPPSFAHVHIAEKLGVPVHVMFTMPWTPTRAFPHPLADIIASNADDVLTNYVSYTLVEMMTWQGLGDVINRFRTNVLDLESLSLLWAPGLISRMRIPTTYCWSPALIPKPADWGEEVSVSGFFFLNLESGYEPDPALKSFLDTGPPPVYIGFGSIVVDDPDALTKTIFDAVKRTGVRALVSKGWGGIGGDALSLPENVFMLGNCPHDWLFKRVAAVVHHGGAGTTAAGINAGKPTVVVPFFGDQIFWGNMIARSGAGPAPIPFKTLTVENFAAAIEKCLEPGTQMKARELGQKIRAEKGADVGGKTFHQFLNTDNMRCSLAPSRVAVWRVRRTHVRLSALAAAVLVREGWLKYTDLKLHRSMEHDTDEQPWDPVSAATAALVGDFSALTLAVADFPREVFKGAKENKKAKEKSGSSETSSSRSTIVGDRNSVIGGDDTASSSASVISPSSSHQRNASHATDAASITSSSTAPTTFSRVDTGPDASKLSPPSTRASGSTSPTREPFNLDLAVGAGKGAMRILGVGAKVHTNFCLGVARGFRNAPKLYHDDTVRPVEKVTGFSSGVRLAGKEFSLGVYDGVSGLFTQPWKGAQKEGPVGLVKGFGKGVGGFFLKNSAAFWSIPAYFSQGVQVQMRKSYFSKTEVMAYIIASRAKQGEEDFEFSTEEERKDILARWREKREDGHDLKGLYGRYKDIQKAEKELGGENVREDVSGPKTGWLRTRGLSFDKRKELHRQKEEWRRTQEARGGVTSPMSLGDVTPPERGLSSGSGSSSTNNMLMALDDHEAIEAAIRESVQRTSNGNPEEDVAIEQLVRASVMGMRRQAVERALAAENQVAENQATGSITPERRQRFDAGWPVDFKGNYISDEEFTNITDEEYQALVEEAVRQSLMEQHAGQQDQFYQPHYGDEKEALKRKPVGGVSSPREETFELPRNLPGTPIQRNSNDHDDDEEQLRRALEESEKEFRKDREKLKRQMTEEEIVLEYVKKQSLQEEEYKRAKRHSGSQQSKGKDVSESWEVLNEYSDEEDEDLKRALEESLNMANSGKGGGPSV